MAVTGGLVMQKVNDTEFRGKAVEELEDLKVATSNYEWWPSYCLWNVNILNSLEK